MSYKVFGLNVLIFLVLWVFVYLVGYFLGLGFTQAQKRLSYSYKCSSANIIIVTPEELEVLKEKY